jgi:DNA helicase II / ATP-dependent DNA helicase PcrA
MGLKKLQQLLRNRRGQKQQSKVLSSPEKHEPFTFSQEKSSIRTKIEVKTEEFSRALDLIREKNLSLYESFKKLNNHQLSAIFSDSKKTLVSAMVGSGKTTVLINKVLYLHFIKDIPLNKMAVLTFTNKAANEIKERIFSFYQQDHDSEMPVLSFFGTFHSVARNILVNSPHLDNIGYTPDFSILDENDRKEFVLRIADENELTIKYRNKIGIRFDRWLDDKKNDRRTRLLYGNMKYEDDLEKLVELVCERKKRDNVMDFDDLINNANLVLTFEDKIFQPQWIIVDEFQDCNRNQIEMITNMSNSETSLFAVGDPNQLIYTWRGSDVSIFHDYKQDRCLEHFLPTNYRSTSSILDVAKHFITYENMSLSGMRSVGVPVTVRNHYDSNQEANYLASILKKFHKEGLPYREIAILVRTNKQTEIFQTVFEKEEIPFEICNRRTVQEIPAINWLSKLFQACLNKRNLNAIYKALCDESYGVVSVSESEIKNYRRACKSSENRDDLKGFIDWISKEYDIADNLGFIDFATNMLHFESWIKDITYETISSLFDYFDLATNLRPASINYIEDVQIVKKFLDHISSYIEFKNTDDIKSLILEAIGGLSLGGHGMLEESIDPNSERVKLLTMHSAKGLEFRFVYISGANNGLIPLGHARKDPEQLLEEKRLFYVAMTRAKDYLEISYHNMPEGWMSSPDPSPFLKEIPDNLIVFDQPRTVEMLNTKLKTKSLKRYNQWYVGQSIKHPKYGCGSIKLINEANLICDFGEMGEKSFAVNFLPISPIEEKAKE